MSIEEQTANGVIKCSQSMDQLFEILIANSQSAKISESSHYQTGRCIRLKHGDARITIEICDSSTYLLSGESGQPLELEILCETTTKALSSAKIIHEIELYDDNEMLKFKRSFGDANDAARA